MTRLLIKSLILLALVTLPTVIYADEADWAPICGEEVRDKLNDDWEDWSRGLITEPKNRRFWYENNIKKFVKRIEFLKDKIPEIYESVLASVDDKLAEDLAQKAQAGGREFFKKTNEWEDAGKKTVWCKKYLDLLKDKVEENQKIIDAATKIANGTEIANGRKSNSEKLRFIKAKVWNEQAQNDWKVYDARLNVFLEKNDLQVKTNDQKNPFESIDANDIKRVKWGLSSEQNYPKTAKGFGDKQFREVIRTAMNYWMCLAHVVMEEMPAGTPENELHIEFTFGNEMLEVYNVSAFGNMLLGTCAPKAINRELKFDNGTSPLRMFPYIRQSDMKMQSDGSDEGGINGKHIIFPDVLSEMNVDGIKFAAPKWTMINGRMVITDPTGAMDKPAELGWMVTHEIGHALGIGHGGKTQRQLMNGQPTNDNTKALQPFLDAKQMSMKKCEEFKVKLDAGDKATAEAAFASNMRALHSTHKPSPKAVRNNLDTMMANIAQDCDQSEKPCRCGLDGLKGCTSKTKVANKGILLLDRIKKSTCTEDCEVTTAKMVTDSGTTESGTTTAAKVITNKQLKPNGVNCELEIQGLQGKSRGFTTTYPDLYYVVKVNGKEKINSENKVINNQVRATWSFKLADQFEGEEKIEVQFYDQDRGRDSWINSDDLIGSAKFSAEKFVEEEKDCGSEKCDEMELLGGDESPYRKSMDTCRETDTCTKYMMSCVDDWIKE